MQKLLTATKNTYKSYKSYRNDNEQKQSGHQSISLKCMGVSGCAFCMAGSSISRPPSLQDQNKSLSRRAATICFETGCWGRVAVITECAAPTHTTPATKTHSHTLYKAPTTSLPTKGVNLPNEQNQSGHIGPTNQFH